MKFWIAIFLPAVILAGCVAESTPTAVPAIAALTPWSSPTPAPTSPAEQAAQVEVQPLPTPEPRTHIIAKGEDLGGLALKYGVPLADILAANPDLDPRMISIGTAVIIPSSGKDNATAPQTVDPGSAGVSIRPPHCLLNSGGGLTCFAEVKNEQDTPVENISLNFVLLDEGGNEISSQVTFAPLNLLPAGAAMPLAANFQGPLPKTYSVRADLAGALPASSGDGRYLNHTLADVKAEIAPDGFSAKVTGQVTVAADQADAATTWVLAVGYNAPGDIVSFRRWEDSAGIESGQGRAFELTLYSSVEKIARVEFLSESRP
jgi:LysM repeat protein